MWTYVRKNNFENFLNEYDNLQDFTDDIILHESEDAYFLPRLFYKNFPSSYLEVFTGKAESYVPEEIKNIKFKGELREEQVPIVERVINLYKNNGFVNGIIKARPGLGKTVLAVYLASKLKIKTMIIVDNQNLMKQWVKAFLDFTNLTEDDIGIIQQKFFGIERPVIIAMAQTLVSKLKDIKNSFKQIDSGKVGLIIYDEVHATSSAPVFSKISLLFRTRNILGLSATPFQTGSAEILMKNTIGEIIYETNKYDLTPEYRILIYKSKIDHKKLYLINQTQDYLKKKALYNKLIVSDENYRNLILEQVKKNKEKGHKIIIICFTKAQVTMISTLLSDHNIENKKFYGEEKDLNYDEDIIVATYSFAGRGFDYKALSCLILACPLAGKKSLIQVVGRILRSDSDKLQPLVIDMIDMAIPTFMIPELRIKKKVISEEFNCKIIEENHLS